MRPCGRKEVMFWDAFVPKRAPKKEQGTAVRCRLGTRRVSPFAAGSPTER